jgi:crotonobetainyl-CoA:carnitine CoA-transferase CaiB-like acyl-CoA transferase
MRNIHVLKVLVSERCAELKCDDMVGRLLEVDVPCAKVMTRDEVLAQEQLWANGTVDIYDHPVVGSSRRILAPPLLGGSDWSPEAVRLHTVNTLVRY